jgi:hypothetical protein
MNLQIWTNRYQHSHVHLVEIFVGSLPCREARLRRQIYRRTAVAQRTWVERFAEDRTLSRMTMCMVQSLHFSSWFNSLLPLLANVLFDAEMKECTEASLFTLEPNKVNVFKLSQSAEKKLKYWTSDVIVFNNDV